MVWQDALAIVWLALLAGVVVTLIVSMDDIFPDRKSPDE